MCMLVQLSVCCDRNKVQFNSKLFRPILFMDVFSLSALYVSEMVSGRVLNETYFYNLVVPGDWYI